MILLNIGKGGTCRTLSSYSSKFTVAGNLNTASICNRHFQNQVQQWRELAQTQIANKINQRWISPNSSYLKEIREQEIAEVIEDQLAKNKMFEFSLNSQRLDQLLETVFVKTMGKVNKKISSEDLILKGKVQINDKIVNKIDHKVEKGDEIEILFDFTPTQTSKKKKKQMCRTTVDRSHRIRIDKELVILDRPFTKIIHILDLESVVENEENKTHGKTYLIKVHIWNEHDDKKKDDDD